MRGTIGVVPTRYSQKAALDLCSVSGLNSFEFKQLGVVLNDDADQMG